MKQLPVLLLYTEDLLVERRMKALLLSQCTVRTASEQAALQGLFQQYRFAAVVVDLRVPEAGRFLHEKDTCTHHVIIALGASRSDPIIQALRAGVYAVEELDPDRIRFQNLIRRANDYLSLRCKYETLKQHAASSTALRMFDPAVPPDHAEGANPLSFFANTFQSCDDLDGLLHRMVEGVVRSASVARAGIFTRSADGKTFCYQAGVRCLQETMNLSFSNCDPFVTYLQIHAHLVCPPTLEHVQNLTQRALLQQALEAFGAEIIIPLHSRGRMTGWLFLGHRVTGIPFNLKELQPLILVADHISTTIENATLYEEVSLQKNLAEALFHSMPIGVIAIGTNRRIHWINQNAQQILSFESSPLNEPMEKLGSRLAGLFVQCLEGNSPHEPYVWEDTRTRRILSAELTQIGDGRNRHGAVALVKDLSRENQIRADQERIKRAAFWNELAASMSHEIRNPLVAIKTFSELLPVKYADEEFRVSFHQIVGDEVKRLNQIVDQINLYANPPELTFLLTLIPRILKKAVQTSLFRLPRKPSPIRIEADENLPFLIADERALVEALSNLLINALEATKDMKKASILLRAMPLKKEEDMFPPSPPDPAGRRQPSVKIIVQDNGPGVAFDDLDSLVSPFLTSKAKGMGLGIPIVQRIVEDHGGRLTLEKTNPGFRVTIYLPFRTPTEAQAALPPEEEDPDEEL